MTRLAAGLLHEVRLLHKVTFFETKNGSYVRRSGIYISTTPSRFSDLKESPHKKPLTGVLKPPSKPGTSEGSQKVWGYRWG